eukprot:m.338336 g.338336  ORF g.338336 m.338336 type:complete len:238 (+) comp18387_c0_seq1:47-760(+)
MVACMGNGVETDNARNPQIAVFKYKVKQYMDAGGDAMFQHNHGYLVDDSVVVEIGGNKGVFAQKLLEKYNIKEMHIIEPVRPMVEKLRTLFDNRAFIHAFAIGIESGEIRMAYRSNTDAAAMVLKDGQTLADIGFRSGTVDTVPVKTFRDAWHTMGLGTVDLLNINIEGAEYAVMEALVLSGVQSQIRNIQVQFHTHSGIKVEDRNHMRCKLKAILSLTHELVYSFDWVWEQWRLKR